MSYAHRFYYTLLLLIIPLAAQGNAIKSLKNFIQEAHTVRATFTQTLLDKNALTIQESSGTMLFERPDKFRWNYEKPYEQLIVGDGVKVWFYDKDLNQVTVRPLDMAIGSSPAALLAGNTSIEDNFQLIELGRNNQLEWLEATPKSNESIFEIIQLGFTPEGTLKIMALRDNFGQTTLLTFSNLVKNPELSADLFKFVPPEGTDIISD